MMRAIDGALMIVSLAIAWSLYRANRAENNFNLMDILMEGGRVSRLACVFMGSFVVSSWIMVRMTSEGKMSEGLFMAYGTVWVAPIIAKLFSPAPLASTSTQTISTQTVTNP